MATSTLNNCIKEIREDSDISALNEEDAKRRVILRILNSLGWDTYGPEIRAEHGVGERRVDYALQINDENKIFIEAKKPEENLDNHQKQLLDYSFGEGVALAILTNGIEWWFYLPLKQGVWNDRRFDTLNLLAQDIEDIAGKFDLLLSRQNVESGKAVQHAESILERRQRGKIFKESLPKAWNSIIENSDRDSLLVDLLKETTEDVCGFRLEEGDVDKISQFIRSHQEKWILSPEQQGIDTSSAKHSNAKTENQTKGRRRSKRPQWMKIDDVRYELRNSFEILVNTANWLIDRGKLKERRIDVTRGGKRVLINHEPVHPSGQKFRSPHQLKNSLYVECHASLKQTIDYSKRLLAKYEYNTEMLKVEVE